MRDSFTKALAFVLKQAGRPVHNDDPLDATNRGITGRVYHAWRRLQNLEERHVREMDEAEARAIYQQAWDACGCDDLPVPFDLVLFDAAAMHGSAQACGWGIRARGGAAVEDDPRGAALNLVELREEAFQRSAQRPKNGDKLRGWLQRTAALRIEAGLPPSEML